MSISSFPIHPPLLQQGDLTVSYRKYLSLHSQFGTLIGYHKTRVVGLRFIWDVPKHLPLNSAIDTLYAAPVSLTYDGSVIKVTRVAATHLSKDQCQRELQKLLGLFNRTEDDDTKQKLLARALQLVDKGFEDSLTLFQIHFNLGLADHLEGLYAKSIFHNRKALEYLERNPTPSNPEVINLLFQIGTSYSKLKAYRQAIFYLEKALKMAQDNQDKEMKVSILYELGITNWNLNETLSSERFFLDSIKLGSGLLSQSTDPDLEARIATLSFFSLVGLGKICLKKRDGKNGALFFDAALSFGKKYFTEDSLDLLKAQSSIADAIRLQKGGDNPIPARPETILQKKAPYEAFETAQRIISELTLFYLKNGQVEKADSTAQKAFKIFQKNNFASETLLESLNRLGSVQFEQLNLNQAEATYTKGMQVSSRIAAVTEPDTLISHRTIGPFAGMGDVLKQRGNYRVALQYYGSAMIIAETFYPGDPNFFPSLPNKIKEVEQALAQLQFEDADKN